LILVVAAQPAVGGAITPAASRAHRPHLPSAPIAANGGDADNDRQVFVRAVRADDRMDSEAVSFSGSPIYPRTGHPVARPRFGEIAMRSTLCQNPARIRPKTVSREW